MFQKHLSRLFLSVLVVLSLTGCGDGDDTARIVKISPEFGGNFTCRL